MSALDMVWAVIHQSGLTGLEPNVLNQASHEIQAQYLSSEKARRLLGWRPRYTLGEGLEETLDWYRDFLGVNA